MAEDIASLATMIEDIRMMLPRFDECISLLRTEIDELKAGKHDHRLREVVANPVDPRLHAVLAKAVDGGLTLPPAPTLSDSDEEEAEGNESDNSASSEEDNAGIPAATKASATSQPDDSALGKRGGRRKGQEEVHAEDDEVQVVVDVEGQNDTGLSAGGQIDKTKAKEAAAGKGEKSKRGGGEGGEDPQSERSGPPKSGGQPDRQQTRAAEPAEATTTPTPGSSKRNGESAKPPTSASSKEKAGASGDDPGGGDGGSAEEETPKVLPPAGNRRTNASPLRDRPPVLSGEAKDSNTPNPAPSTPSSSSSKHHASSKVGDENRRSSGKGERDSGRESRNNGDSIRSYSPTVAAMTAGEHVSPISKKGKPSDAADANKKEDDGSEVKNPGGGARTGRKRPRTEAGTTAENSRDVRPSSGRRDERDGGAEDDHAPPSKAEEERPDSNGSDGQHFRRIALEVWDRVNKHKFAIIFRKAVNPKDAPGYEKVIKKPMDLSLIRENIMSGALASLDDMSRDLFVMCNNAMVFNGAGDPYFDYSKELRTYASEIIEEARRPGFVTADPGFDSVVAGSRTSRRPPELAAAAAAPRSNPRGKNRKGTVSSGSRNFIGNRDSDTASVAYSTGDEGGKSRRGGGSRGSAGGSSVDGDAKDRKRGGGASTAAMQKKGKIGVGKKGACRGGKSHASSDDGAESGEMEDSSIACSSGGEEEKEEEEDEEAEQSASASDENRVQKQGGAKKGTAGRGVKGKKKRPRRREVSDDSSDDEPSVTRGKARKATKPAAKAKGRAGKRRIS